MDPLTLLFFISDQYISVVSPAKTFLSIFPFSYIISLCFSMTLPDMTKESEDRHGPGLFIFSE